MGKYARVGDRAESTPHLLDPAGTKLGGMTISASAPASSAVLAVEHRRDRCPSRARVLMTMRADPSLRLHRRQYRVNLQALSPVWWEFNIGAEARLGVALAARCFRLSEAERLQVTRLSSSRRVNGSDRHQHGRASTDLAVLYSQTAEEAGAERADGHAPELRPAGSEEMRSTSARSPTRCISPSLFRTPAAPPIPASLVGRSPRKSERVRYIKVESTPLPQQVAEAVDQAGDLLTVFGGPAAITSLRAEAAARRDQCELQPPEAFVEVWSRCHRGGRTGCARRLRPGDPPVNRIAARGWSPSYHTHKEVLRRRGVIKREGPRPSRPWTSQTSQELQVVIDELYGGAGEERNGFLAGNAKERKKRKGERAWLEAMPSPRRFRTFALSRFPARKSLHPESPLKRRTMKIVDLQVIPFRVPRGRSTTAAAPGEPMAVQTLTGCSRMRASRVLSRRAWPRRPRRANGRRAALMEGHIRSLVVGQNPFDRERFWHWLWAPTSQRTCSACSTWRLWDLQGRAFGVPVHKLLGGCRDG